MLGAMDTGPIGNIRSAPTYAFFTSLSKYPMCAPKSTADAPTANNKNGISIMQVLRNIICSSERGGSATSVRRRAVDVTHVTMKLEESSAGGGHRPNIHRFALGRVAGVFERRFRLAELRCLIAPLRDERREIAIRIDDGSEGDAAGERIDGGAIRELVHRFAPCETLSVRVPGNLDRPGRGLERAERLAVADDDARAEAA